MVVFCLVESLLQGFKESFEYVTLIAAVWVSLRVLFLLMVSCLKGRMLLVDRPSSRNCVVLALCRQVPISHSGGVCRP